MKKPEIELISLVQNDIDLSNYAKRRIEELLVSGATIEYEAEKYLINCGLEDIFSLEILPDRVYLSAYIDSDDKYRFNDLIEKAEKFLNKIGYWKSHEDALKSRMTVTNDAPLSEASELPDFFSISVPRPADEENN